jgi:hypothetical protein
MDHRNIVKTGVVVIIGRLSSGCSSCSTVRSTRKLEPKTQMLLSLIHIPGDWSCQCSRCGEGDEFIIQNVLSKT